MSKWKILLIFTAFIFLLLIPGTGYSQAPLQDHTIYLPTIIKSKLNVLNNGDFEAGRSSWVEFEDSTFFDFPLIVKKSQMPASISPRTGEWAAWLGGESDLNSYIEQPLTIPQSSPELVYWLRIDSISACDASHGGVSLNGVIILEQYDLCKATAMAGWNKRTIALDAYAGQKVTLRIFSQTGPNNYSGIYVDDVEVYGSP
jgi:hypothetical protein